MQVLECTSTPQGRVSVADVDAIKRRRRARATRRPRSPIGLQSRARKAPHGAIAQRQNDSGGNRRTPARPPVVTVQQANVRRVLSALDAAQHRVAPLWAENAAFRTILAKKPCDDRTKPAESPSVLEWRAGGFPMQFSPGLRAGPHVPPDRPNEPIEIVH